MRFLPNILSGFRIIAVPFLLYFSWKGSRNLFIGLLIISLATDAVDGFISRKFNLESPIGAKLDSWGDMATYLTVPLCAWWLWPDMLKKEAVFVFLVIGAYVLPILAGLIKFHQIPSYHTWGAKTAAVFMSGAVLIMFIWEITGPFRLAAVFQALVAVEEIMITIRLNSLQQNVKSFWHLAQK